MKRNYDKHAARTRRGARHKARLKHSTRPRLVIFRSNLHIYAQIVIQGEKGNQVIAAAGTVDKNLKSSLDKKTKVEQALEVGKLLAERAKEKQIKEVVFDRAGYKYHGRVKALADGAREAGLNF